MTLLPRRLRLVTDTPSDLGCVPSVEASHAPTPVEGDLSSSLPVKPSSKDARRAAVPQTGPSGTAAPLSHLHVAAGHGVIKGAASPVLDAAPESFPVFPSALALLVDSHRAAKAADLEGQTDHYSELNDPVLEAYLARTNHGHGTGRHPFDNEEEQ